MTSQAWQTGSTPGTQSYTYDATNQLITAGAATYSYDPNGNRTMSGYQTGTGNELTTDGVWTYTYDNQGNETQKSKGAGLETWYYGYDTLNRLVTVRQTSDGSTNELLVTYTYDVFGNRVQQAEWKSGSGTLTTRFHYDGQNVRADTDTSNNVQVRYLRGNQVDQLFARTEASGQPNPGVAWYLTDRLGSVRDLMDSTGTVRDHLDYDGYGNATESSAGYGDRYKFTGREYDSATALQYNRARYYDPRAGRWTSQDPLGLAAGDSNLYRYASNVPTNETDPLGLAPPPSKPPAPGGNTPPSGGPTTGSGGSNPPNGGQPTGNPTNNINNARQQQQQIAANQRAQANLRQLIEMNQTDLSRAQGLLDRALNDPRVDPAAAQAMVNTAIMINQMVMEKQITIDRLQNSLGYPPK